MNFTQLDQQLFRLINSEWSNSFFDVVLPYWTDFQRGPWFVCFILPMILLVLFLKARWKGWGFFTLGLAFMGVVDFIFGRWLKGVIARPRPAFSELDFEVILRGPSFGGFSFPSSHALDAFFLAAFWSYFCPALRWPLFILASLTAYSRVYCGLHFPSDVLGGAAIGLSIGLLAAWTARRVIQKISGGRS